MSLSFEKSKKAYEEACQFIPGGVNSPVRAFAAVGDHPIFIERGEGSHVFDIDGNELIDYVCSWGPLIFGHNRPEIKENVIKQLDKGSTFGMPTEIETEMAEKICQLIPSIEMVRMVSSGTEATMSALRLARGYTGKNKIIKFEGCYHGHADHLLIKAGSGAMTLGVPSSPGVPEGIAKDTLTATYNDIDSVEDLLKSSDDIAAVIIEPIPGNMGIVPPKEGFLEDLRRVCDQYGVLLIFDEVISGFRASIGGAQAKYNVMPDLTCLGKIIGGGLPVGAFGGRRDIMEKVAPLGPVYQAGTLSGNPLAMTAGLTTLKLLEANPDTYEIAEQHATKLVDGFKKLANDAGVDICINQVGSLFTMFFTAGPVTSYTEATKSDTKAYGEFFQVMLHEGVHLPPSQFECWFLSSAHTDEDIEKTLAAAEKAFAAVKK